MSPPAFVGRERQLADLADVLAYPSAVLLIEGEAGVGKSRLLREFLASPAGSSTGLSVAAACPPLREPYTLGPVVDAVRGATDRVGGLRLSGLAGALRPLFPEWADDLPAAPEPAEDARAARHRLFRALTELLARLGVAVLVVEDVHWADDATLEFLLFLASCQPPPMRLVVSYRPEDVPADSLLLRLSSRLPPGTRQARLVVGPLDVAETASMVSSMLGGERLSDEFAAFLYERTDGVPLAVEESVRLMHDRADVARQGGMWVRRQLADIDVPPTVRDAVSERYRRLSGDAQLVLRAVAVLDGPAGETMLATVGDLPADRAVTALAEALDCGLVEEDKRGLVAFRHGLAARAVHEAIPGPQRRAMHLRAGRALEEISPPPVARLSRHFREAGDTGAWARYAEQAADTAVAAGDWVGAATLLHELMVSAELPPAALAPLAAKIHPGALTGTSRVRDVTQALQAALASKTLDASQEAMTRYQLGVMLEGMDDYDGSHRELELAIPALAVGSLERVQAMLVLGWARGSSCPGRVHRDWLRRAADAAGAVPPAEQPDITFNRALALLLLDEPEGWAVAAGLSDEVSTSAQRRNVTRRDLNLGEMAMRWGRYAEARGRLDHALELSERYHYPRYREHVRTALIQLDWFTGTWDGLADQAADLAGSEDTLPMNRLQASLVTGQRLAADGRHAEAERTLQGVLSDMRDLGAVETVDPAAALARLYMATGRAEDALRVTEQPIDVVALKETWLWATDLAPVRVEALIRAGRLDDAAELAAAFGGGVEGRDAPAARAAVVVCEAIMAAGHGEQSRAAEAFGRAAAAWDALPRPYDALLTRERQAHCLLAAGRNEAGLEFLAGVGRGLVRLGARGDASRLFNDRKYLGADAAGTRRRGRPGYGDRLSPRELEVVHLLVDGRTNQDIADALVVSRPTVNSHVRSAMRKLRVSSRTALAVTAVELGLAREDRAFGRRDHASPADE